MDKPHKSFSVSECKTKASLLLKALRSGDISKAKSFQRLPEFAHFSLEEIMQAKIQLKHALAVIAAEKGFASWSELKTQLPFIRGGFLNQWFANYVDAKSYQQSTGGFLLPYQKQFFICDANYMTQLGFDADDPDWKLIGYDWAQPNDQSAWQRLYKKWMKIQESRHE